MQSSHIWFWSYFHIWSYFLTRIPQSNILQVHRCNIYTIIGNKPLQFECKQYLVVSYIMTASRNSDLNKLLQNNDPVPKSGIPTNPFHITGLSLSILPENIRKPEVNVLNVYDIKHSGVFRGYSKRAYDICSKLIIKTSERRYWLCSGVFINFEHISHLFLVFLLLTLNYERG